MEIDELDYTQLTGDQKYQIVKSRLGQLQQQHFDASIQLITLRAAKEAENLPELPMQKLDEQINHLELQQAQWEKAIEALQPILDSMPKPATEPVNRQQRRAAQRRHASDMRTTIKAKSKKVKDGEET